MPGLRFGTDADVQKQIKDLKKKEGGGSKKKEKSGFDLMEQQFSELAECSPEQAKEFLKALERVRKIEDENGVPISDLMRDEWRKIIEERKVESLDYRGPVRMDEGSRLEDPVSAKIDIKALTGSSSRLPSKIQSVLKLISKQKNSTRPALKETR